MQERLTLSVIIPTYNRPKEVADAVASIVAQSRVPDELIVVDDGNLPAAPLEAECRAAGIRYRMLRKEKPGLTESRNLGIAEATGDIVAFFDDDVVLERDCLEELVRVFEDDVEGRIGGVSCNITNYPEEGLADLLRRWAETFFLIDGPRQGKALRSGFFSEIHRAFPPDPPVVDVDYLSGMMAYRREVFRWFRFTPGFNDLGVGEDKDFSCQVGTRYRLVAAARSRLVHLWSPVMRANKRREGRQFVVGRYLLFRRFRDRGLVDRILFAYALAGYVGIRTLSLLVRPNGAKLARLMGVFEACRDVVAGRIPVPF